MDIIQCKFCKRPFQSINSKICPSCLEQIDKDFIVVRDYIYDNKKADIDEVSEETGVNKAIVLHLLREGRLQIVSAESSGGLLFCEVCKKPISKGRLCEACRNDVSSTMKQSVGGGAVGYNNNQNRTAGKTPGSDGVKGGNARLNS